MESDKDKPIWWNRSGKGTYVVKGNIGGRSITVTNGVGHLIIYKPVVGTKKTYTVRWMIFGKGGKEVNAVDGYRQFTKEQILTAFGVSQGNPITDTVFAEKHDAVCGIPGLFIRKLGYLNVPCPGTGIDGDPNLSAFISLSVGEDVRRFLS